MQPKSPLTQTYAELPNQLPLYPIENALLPGGELPLELAKPEDLALFIKALRTDQLIGMVQPKVGESLYSIGCAGRIRQYRERKDGRLNIMLTGLCRYKIIDLMPQEAGYLIAKIDWSAYQNDYTTEYVEPTLIAFFKQTLRNYFDRHKMQVDWKVLDKLPIEQVANNLVLLLNLSIQNKQQLLEALTVTQRLKLFCELLESKVSPILTTSPASSRIN